MRILLLIMGGIFLILLYWAIAKIIFDYFENRRKQDTEPRWWYDAYLEDMHYVVVTFWPLLFLVLGVIQVVNLIQAGMQGLSTWALNLKGPWDHIDDD